MLHHTVRRRLLSAAAAAPLAWACPALAQDGPYFQRVTVFDDRSDITITDATTPPWAAASRSATRWPWTTTGSGD